MSDPTVQPAPNLASVEGWRALLVPAEGPLRDVVIAKHGSGLADLRRFTGADCITCTDGPDGLTAWLDDEGAVTVPPRPVNARLTMWAQRRDNWQLCGDAVITGRTSPTGSITSLSAVQAERLRAAIDGGAA